MSAQDCWTAGNGAYTGETSADMLKDMGVGWCIIGHSERRQKVNARERLRGKLHFLETTAACRFVFVFPLAECNHLLFVCGLAWRTCLRCMGMGSASSLPRSSLAGGTRRHANDAMQGCTCLVAAGGLIAFLIYDTNITFV